MIKVIDGVKFHTLSEPIRVYSSELPKIHLFMEGEDIGEIFSCMRDVLIYLRELK